MNQQNSPPLFQSTPDNVDATSSGLTDTGPLTRLNRTTRLVGAQFHRCLVTITRTLDGKPVCYEVVELNVKRKQIEKSRNPVLKSLTPKEQEVFDWVVKGLSNAAVAHEIGTSEKAVKYHLTNIFKKKGVHSRVQLIVKVQDQATA